MLIHIKFVLLIFLFCMQYINIKSLLVFGILDGISFVNSPIGPVYTHFTGDVVTVPLILDKTQKPSQVLRYIKGNVCTLVFFI